MKNTIFGFFLLFPSVIFAAGDLTIRQGLNGGNFIIQATSVTAGGGATSLDDLSDVTLTSPAANDLLTYNGSVWVNAPSGTSFSFAVNTFSDSQSATIEQGVGVWKSTGNLSFTASYSNGPPIGSTITFSGWSALPLASPFTSTTSIASVNFPTVGGTVVFTLTAQKSTTATKTITHTFDNDRYWGVTSLSGGVYMSTNISSGLGNSELSNAIAKTFTVVPGVGQYIVYAYPSRLGTATFTVGGFSGGFLPAVTVSVTNGSSFAENFSVYRSVNSNLGSTTVTVTTP